jgi:hypothetical protein
LSAVAGLNIGWLLHEMYRGHYPEYKIWKVSNSKSMMSDLEGDFGVADGHKVPPWMDKIQTMVSKRDSFVETILNPKTEYPPLYKYAE